MTVNNLENSSHILLLIHTNCHFIEVTLFDESKFFLLYLGKSGNEVLRILEGLLFSGPKQCVYILLPGESHEQRSLEGYSP